MKYIIATIQPDRLNDVMRSIKSGPTGFGINRINVSNVNYHDHEERMTPIYRGYVQQDNLLPQLKVDFVVEDRDVQAAVDAITLATEDEGIIVLDLVQHVSVRASI